MAEFAAKFEDMATQSSQTLYVSDERWKINPFKISIRVEIKHMVDQERYNTCANLLDQCYIIEHNLKKIPQEREKFKKCRGDHGRTSQHMKPRGSPSKI